jgi:hypothetical protein
VKQSELAGVFAGNLFEVLNPLELAAERPVIFKPVSPDDLGRAQCAGGLAARQPDFTVSSATDAPQKFVVRNSRPGDRRRGQRC